MRHQKKGFKLGRKKAHRDAMLANMAVSLFIHGQIQTTTQKAKALKEFAEKLITFAKKGDLHSRRIVLSRLKTKSRAIQTSVNFLFDKVAPIFQNREGGYTRIFKVGFRKGDNAEMSLLKLIGFEGLDFQAYLAKEDTTPKSEPKAEKKTVQKEKSISPQPTQEKSPSEEKKVENTELQEEDKETQEVETAEEKIEEQPESESESEVSEK